MQDLQYRSVNKYRKINSGITLGRVLNGELYAQRLQKLIYLHFFYKDCFMKVLFNFHETVCK